MVAPTRRVPYTPPFTPEESKEFKRLLDEGYAQRKANGQSTPSGSPGILDQTKKNVDEIVRRRNKAYDEATKEKYLRR